MNALKLKSLRVEKGLTQADMGEKIEKSNDSYAKKERGEVLFSPDEMCIVAIALDMDYELFNYIFFDNKLPFGNINSENEKRDYETERK
jgi:transcriptional regulator with XRE-family HTH domain